MRIRNASQKRRGEEEKSDGKCKGTVSEDFKCSSPDQSRTFC